MDDLQNVLVRRDAFANARRVFTATGKGTVAFLGGSITQMDGWRVKVMADLQRRFPRTEFTFICAGLASTCSDAGALRMRDDVLAKGTPDLFFVEYAVNDSLDGYFLAGRHAPETHRTHSLRGVEGVVRHMRAAAPDCDMVMTFFVTAQQLEELRAGRIPETYATDARVAEHYGVTTVNIGQSLINGEKDGTFSWQDYGGDCHPHERGCARIAGEYARLFDAEWTGETASCIQPHALPEMPLDAGCYRNGGYLSWTKVKLGAGWQVAPVDWSQIPGNCRADYRDGEILFADIPGAECSFAFRGTAVGAFVLAGPDSGSLEVAIDDGNFMSYRLFTRYSKGERGLHYPFMETFADDLAPEKEHRVRLRVGEDRHPDSSGNAVRLYRLGANFTF